MRQFIKFVVIGGMALSSGALTGLPASAQDLELRVGPGGVGVYNRDQDRNRDNRYDYDRGRERASRQGCDPDDALDSARDAGFRRAHVVRVTSRNIVVDGFTRGGPDRIVFANVRGCPEVG
jgi:hypothetical protein